MYKICNFVVIILSINWIFLSACKNLNSTEDIAAVKNFEVEKYMGTWHEIARLPHYFENNMEFVTAEYSLVGKNKIRVVNSGIKDGKLKRIEGKVRFLNEVNNRGELEVSFVPPFWSKYRIIYLSADYQNAVVTGNYKNYLWILSKGTELSDKDLQMILKKIKDWGYDSSKLYYPKVEKN